MALKDNIVWYWKADTNGSFPDSVGSNNGTINGATYTASGKINWAYSFDWTNDKITINTSFPSEWWISFWFTADVFGTGWYASTNTNNNTLLHDTTAGYLWISSGLSWEISVNLYDTEFKITTITSLSVDTWYHLVATWDTSNYYVYLNGSLEWSWVFSGLSALSDWVVIGSTYENNRYWDWNFDEFGIFDSLLSQTDVTNLYNGWAGNQYPFIEGNPIFFGANF